MKVSNTVTAVVGAAAGLAVALGAYLATAEPAGTPTSSSSSTVDPAGSTTNGGGLAPCDPPSRLVDGVCVTEVHRTVVVQDSPGTGSEHGEHGDGRYDDDAHEVEDD